MYYIMNWRVPLGDAAIQLRFLERHRGAWMLGARFEPDQEPPNPLRMRFNPDTSGSVLLDLYQSPVVLMSKRLVTTLQSAGVDNLDLYPATILDEETNTLHESHVAVNIIGTVSAADVAQSELDPRVPERELTAAFDKLVIDEAKARGQLLFRLAERVGAIVVHERVKDTVDEAKFQTIGFMEPEDWMSF